MGSVALSRVQILSQSIRLSAWGLSRKRPNHPARSLFESNPVILPKQGPCGIHFLGRGLGMRHVQYLDEGLDLQCSTTAIFEQRFFLHKRAMTAMKLQECSRSLGPAGCSLAQSRVGYLVRVVCVVRTLHKTYCV